ncbi:MAG: biopolymer transporter ExbD [Lewinellaceae bacterium]|nr:biopolymer transporter ExbD [Saprospiraceae bacterium]MCB9316293.1 biopolymer transporter ExbD [Lewinellaceae bacterium]MCB9333001.1 biopolymer transporter ExbD [Lewinellaceae bacterium]
MAEMQTADSGARKKGGKVRSKKLSTRVDLTPMVDLAFLLITFFMLTTTLAKPTIMPVVMPEKDVDEEDLQATKESQVLTLILGADDKIYYYEGITDAKLDSTDYSAEGLRQVILDKKDRVKQQWGDMERDDPKNPGQKKFISKLNVIIKPTEEARYKNIVDAFDEMKITNVALYVLLDISDQEKAFIKNPAGGLQFTIEEQAAATTE